MNLQPSSVLSVKANVGIDQIDFPLITAVSGKKIRVISFILSCGDVAINAVFNTKPAGAGTAISNAFSLGINGQVVVPINEYSWFETNSGEGLTITTQ